MSRVPSTRWLVESQLLNINSKEIAVNFFKKEKGHSSGMDLGNYDDSQVPVQLKKIMDHLGFLEKKIDMLLDQSRHRGDSRPGFGNRNFSGGRGGNYRPSNREGFSQRHSGSSDNRGNRYESHRPARPGHHAGKPFQKKYAPQTSQGNAPSA